MFIIPKNWNYKNDPFDEKATIFENNIAQSCFWELLLLKRHYLEDIRQVFIDFLFKTENNDFIDLSEYRHLQLDELFKQKLKRVKIN